MTDRPTTLSGRREILFLYDIRMGNPNGDPDENRPRRLPDGRFYVTDVRLKRFVRDYFAAQGREILVGNVDGRTTNLTGRVGHHLKKIGKDEANGEELVEIILMSFIDARLFGSALAFKEQEEDVSKGIQGWKPQPEPKTLTGPVQFNMGEIIHEAEEVIIQGTSVFASAEEKTQGTFTSYAALRYALIAFNGVANEHSAKKSCMTNEDYDAMLDALWNGVRSAGNTRTKVGQVPRLLVSLEYNDGEEYQFGNLIDYVSLKTRDGKPEKHWASPDDYLLDLSNLLKRIESQESRIGKIRYEISPDIHLAKDVKLGENGWTSLQFETPLDNKQH